MNRVYMYTFHERMWHWVQSLVILAMIATGIIIHAPDLLGNLAFEYAVLVHNALGFLLIGNAVLGLLYHVFTGEIRQYLPQPRGFFVDSINQAMYYLSGIFKNKPHPFEKTPEKKLNPLQKITYLMILNVLLPIQVATGLLMWSAQHIPRYAALVGDLSFLAPVHTLTAWLFGAFIIMHVYLTTTGHTPLANIKAMIFGWEEIPSHPTESQGG